MIRIEIARFEIHSKQQISRRMVDSGGEEHHENKSGAEAPLMFLDN